MIRVAAWEVAVTARTGLAGKVPAFVVERGRDVAAAGNTTLLVAAADRKTRHAAFRRAAAKPWHEDTLRRQNVVVEMHSRPFAAHCRCSSFPHRLDRSQLKVCSDTCLTVMALHIDWKCMHLPFDLPTFGRNIERLSIAWSADPVAYRVCSWSLHMFLPV